MPRLTIGLPVYNGEAYLSQCLESLLGQSFEDFQLIISDNASSDRTRDICLDFSSKDSRVGYHRQNENIGGGANFNKVFELSSTELFKWQAHDDMCHPDFLRCCIKAIDADANIIGAYTCAVTVDADGKPRGEWCAGSDLLSPLPFRRLREALEPSSGAPGRRFFPLPVFGVLRADSLRRTSLLDRYPGSDRALLVELALLGRFDEIPKPMFIHRDHPAAVGRALGRKARQAVAWWDPSLRRTVRFPEWYLFGRFARAIRQSNLGTRERLRCIKEFTNWSVMHTHDLLTDFLKGLETLRYLGPPASEILGVYENTRWELTVRRGREDLAAILPSDATLVLIDDDCLGTEFLPGDRTMPFGMPGMASLGPPENDIVAIEVLEAHEDYGTDFVVVAWPAFWWLDFYPNLANYLATRCDPVLANDRLEIYRLNEASGDDHSTPVEHSNTLGRVSS